MLSNDGCIVESCAWCGNVDRPANKPVFMGDAANTVDKVCARCFGSAFPTKAQQMAQASLVDQLNRWPDCTPTIPAHLLAQLPKDARII